MSINGEIVNAGDTVEFTYAGDVQEWTVPETGLYRLEVFGAKGGNYGSYTGGKGGHSVGYKLLKAGEKIYVVTGGSGGYHSVPNSNNPAIKISGGYNGGGYVMCGPYHPVSSGGGATHIAMITGLLSELSAQISDILIVAGGGGAASGGGGNGKTENGLTSGSNGGAGGGLTGGNGSRGPYNSSSYAEGGTQTAGGKLSDQTTTTTYITNGKFGVGGSEPGAYGGAGGGGFYGGASGGQGGSGSGGSGYIDGVSEITYKGKKYIPSTENGINNGNGYAYITLIGKGGLNNILAFGDEDIGMVVGDVEITGISFGSIQL